MLRDPLAMGRQKGLRRCTDGYRKNKATFHAVPPARVRPPPATLRPLVPTPGGGPPAPRCPPGAGLARAGPEVPTPAAGQPWREPAGHRPAPQGTARTAAGPPARLGLLGNGLCHRLRPPTLSPPRHRPRSPPAHPRPVAAALRSQRWPPDGGGWPCAAWVMGRRRRWGGGGGTDANAMSLLKNAMSLLLKRLIQASGGAGWATGWVHTGCGKGRLIFLYPAQPPATPAGGATRRRALGRECPALSTRV